METTSIAAGRGDEAAEIRRELDQLAEITDRSQVREDSRNLHHRGPATRLMRTLSFGEPDLPPDHRDES